MQQDDSPQPAMTSKLGNSHSSSECDSDKGGHSSDSNTDID